MKKVVLIVSSKRLKAGCPTCEATKKFWRNLREKYKFDYQEIDIDTKKGSTFAEKYFILSAPTTVINDKVAFAGLPNREERIKILKKTGIRAD